MVASTVSRSSVELTARPTSPSAVSWSTRARQLARACLQLGEQARVLDGDHRLVGEGLQELDLRLRERLGSRLRRITPTGSSVPQHRHAEHASVAHGPGEVARAGNRSSRSTSGTWSKARSATAHSNTVPGLGRKETAAPRLPPIPATWSRRSDTMG